MLSVLLKSLGISIIVIIIMALVQNSLHTEKYLSDIGGINAFLVVFGALYGIISAFIVVEVWNKFNNTKKLIQQEAQDLEKLLILSFYFRDQTFVKAMREMLIEYIELILKDGFMHLGKGSQQKEETKTFREIGALINEVHFDDDHDSTIFSLIVQHYTEVSQLRIERIHQSTLRLPFPLRLFFYVASLFTVITFIFMPFAAPLYGLFVTGILVFSLTLLIYIVEDLDNPFTGGFWRVTTEPFQEAIGYIKKDQ